jgi:hypothetical protein
MEELRATMTLEDRIKRSIAKHPEWANSRIADNVRGARAPDIARVRADMAGVPPPAENKEPGFVSLDKIIQKYDTYAAILHEIKLIPRGKFIPQEDLCRAVAGMDRARFNRCIEIRFDEFKVYRIKLRLKDSPEGKWYWAHPDDIIFARQKVEEYT